jgi:hypothetical protein
MTAIDWVAAERVADRLGAHTRNNLVAERDVDAIIAWALRLAAECGAADVSPVNWPRAASYLELAVLLGHEHAGTEAEVIADAA